MGKTYPVASGYLPLVIFLLSLVNLTSSQGISEDLFNADVVDILLSGGQIHKCHCESNEALIQDESGNSTCIPSETLIPITLSPEFPEHYANASSFGKVQISKPECSNETSLTPIHARDFFFYPNGTLLHLPTHTSYPSNDYCIEHMPDHFGNISFEVNLCLPQPKIPVCCSEEDQSEFNCSKPEVILWFGFSFLKEPKIDVLQTSPMQCKESEIVGNVPLESPSSQAYLDHSVQSTYMVLYSTSADVLPSYLTSDKYCVYPVASQFGVIYDAAYCMPNPLNKCKNKNCIMKCCPDGTVFSAASMGCVPAIEDVLWTPSFATENGTELNIEVTDYETVNSLPLCKKYYLLDSKKKSFSLLPTGELNVKGIDYSEPPPRYCIDHFISNSGDFQENALLCFPEKPKEVSTCRQVKPIILSIALSVSCFFLLITLVVYASIKELHAKIHGKSLLSHAASLLVAYISLTVTTSSSTQLTMMTCRVFAFIVQISFLGAFFWLNVMCFDIWWTLRSMRPVAESGASFRRRFGYFSLYAWGCPLIIAIVTLVMENLRDLPEYDYLILPGFGIRNCWFADKLRTWIYFYSFISIITVANLGFFIAVAIILIQAHRANSTILKNNTQQQQNKKRIWVYLKLFVVMGVSWILEVASWQDSNCGYWIFTDIINCLQGFFIFLIFICKKGLWAKIRNGGKAPARQIKRMVHGSSSYGSQASQQTSLDSTTSFRKLSTTLHYHLSRLQRESTIPEHE